ncbi:hypothetical protein AYO21_01727 [Fonsecaea monophora]|uniref:Uncharacterized protein n=1 Tax=Fonsecaea monophora TaxID=254056 RepID=A0A177FHX9_9EURO|nr:hypothetical protein AYO21_01727 [Fonsecaea monophora]OAG43875.1 hypothetical protein AYO21_01727 [Fonsecaea monophora]
MRVLRLRADVSRAPRVSAVQVRTLWWWGRQTGSPWSPTEDFEERARRHHKIMKSRYYKVLRRRALWESEDAYVRPLRHHRLWAHRYCDYKPLSSTGASSQGPKEPDNEQDNHAQTIYKDFDAFREAVDRAIARDPYGTLFGRRLQSPPSANNSSWTSFSWFSDPKEIKKEHNIEEPSNAPSVATNAAAETRTSSFETEPDKQEVRKSTSDVGEEEYEYDPISMRKVPLKKHTAEPERKEEPGPVQSSAVPEPERQPQRPKEDNASSDEHSKQPFLKSLFFQEHGVDIPVKTYKSHRVYGYGASDKNPSDDHPAPSTKTEGFHSSRKEELRDLMSRAKGNNIDTTALFTELSGQSQPETVTSDTTAPKMPRESPEPDDTLPLFSGTTYEARAHKETETNASDWLSREGFRERNEDSGNATNPHGSSVNEAISITKNKLEPALERVNRKTALDQTGKSPRLQTALDRQISASPQSTPFIEKQVGINDVPATLPSEKTEAGESKRTTRERLETDFEARQQDAANESIVSPKTPKLETPTKRLTKTLNNVWEHIREYPNGIVAKTMNSMTNLNENYKKYVRHDAVKGLTDKLVFKDESLQKIPSIYKSNIKPQSLATFTPSHTVLADESKAMQRTADLREATENAKKDEELKKAQMSQLAADIQAVYESEYGPINAEHRQPAQSSPEAKTVASASSTSERDLGKPHPLSTASVRPGITTNPVIDNHISKFEPKFASLVDEAKQIRAELHDVEVKAQEAEGFRQASSQAEVQEQAEEVKPPLHKLSDVMQGAKEVRRELHEAQNTIRRIGSGRPATAWNAPQLSGSDFGKKRIDIKVQKGVDALEAPTGSVVQQNTNSDADTQTIAQPQQEEEPKTVPEPVHTPSGSPVWNDEQPPPIESMKIRKFDSPYLILTYDTAAEKINFSPMNQPTTELPKSSNVIGILGRLKNAPEFLKHFQTMQRAGYSLYNGTDNMLIFQKKQAEHVTTSSITQAAKEKTSTPGVDISSRRPDQEAATVLDELPTELDPIPGPAAPTAPVSRPPGNQPRVRRQENVFSGTIRPNALSSSSPPQAPDEKSAASDSVRGRRDTQDEGILKRFVRRVKYTLLTFAALGFGAYSIGFVAEGLSAHNQQRGIDNGDVQGPRKRIVLTGQRPGIFSTESSR